MGPLLPLLGAAIPSIVQMFKKQDTGAQLAGMGIQAGINGIQNLFQRRYERKMWEAQVSQQQRAWTMQNEYNSPVAQMERLRQAGLNPNLVYGRGADNTAGPVQVSSPTISRRQPIEFNPANSILAAQDLRIKQAQYDNLRANNTMIAQDIALKTANLAKVAADTAKTRWEVERSRSLFGYAMEAAKLNNENITQNISLNKGRYEMDMAIKMQGLETGVMQQAYIKAQTARNLADVGRIYQTIELMKKDGMIKDFEIKLNKAGFTKSDPVYLRAGKMITDKILEGVPMPAIKDFLKGLWDGIKSTGTITDHDND